MTDRSLERLVQDPALAHPVEPSQLGFELAHVPWRPLLHDRRIEAAELCDVEERPRPFDGRRGRCDRELIPQPVPERRHRATERELPRGFVECGPFEQQADREVSAQRDREIPCRDAVGPLFDLPHDAGPPSQGQQFGAQIVLALVILNTELTERVCDRVERAPFSGVVVGDEAGERSGPTAALRRQRRAVDLQKAAVNPAGPSRAWTSARGLDRDIQPEIE